MVRVATYRGDVAGRSSFVVCVERESALTPCEIFVVDGGGHTLRGLKRDCCVCTYASLV